MSDNGPTTFTPYRGLVPATLTISEEVIRDNAGINDYLNKALANLGEAMIENFLHPVYGPPTPPDHRPNYGPPAPSAFAGEFELRDGSIHRQNEDEYDRWWEPVYRSEAVELVAFLTWALDNDLLETP